VLTQGQRFEYSKEVWLEFIKRRGSVRPAMSSLEWNQICTWMDDQVPLRVVLTGIRECGGTPRTLMYCVPSVREEAVKVARLLA